MDLFRVLGEPTRLAIVRRMAAGETRVADLQNEFGLAQSTISSHIARLRNCGLVSGRDQGTQTFYSLSPPMIEFLTATQRVLTATGRTFAVHPGRTGD